MRTCTYTTIKMRNISWQAFNMRTALMAASLKCATSAGKHLIMRTALMAALCATSAGKHLSCAQH